MQTAVLTISTLMNQTYDNCVFNHYMLRADSTNKAMLQSDSSNLCYTNDTLTKKIYFTNIYVTMNTSVQDTAITFNIYPRLKTDANRILDMKFENITIENIYSNKNILYI